MKLEASWRRKGPRPAQIFGACFPTLATFQQHPFLKSQWFRDHIEGRHVPRRLHTRRGPARAQTVTTWCDMTGYNDQASSGVAVAESITTSLRALCPSGPDSGVGNEPSQQGLNPARPPLTQAEGAGGQAELPATRCEVTGMCILRMLSYLY